MSSPVKTQPQMPTPNGSLNSSDQKSISISDPIEKFEKKPDIISEATTNRDKADSTATVEPKGNGDEAKSDSGAGAVGATLEYLEAAKVRYEADLAKHAYDPIKADRVQDDWQVAYAWAFIVKFGQVEKIRKLECLEDFERCLLEPVANRPDDVLEGVLIRFLSNLKPGLRNLDCTNIQTHLSNYISDMLLNSTEFTVWDRPWAPHEEVRSGCCNTSTDRSELGRLRCVGEDPGERVGRNPLKQMEARGGGLFELDWHERAKLLRQMVDWQLSHSDAIRTVIKEAQPIGKKTAVTEEMANALKTDPIGLDRSKSRIWSLDSSPRLYKSGNPFKRPCPLVAISSTRAELQSIRERYATHGALTPSKPSGSGPKGRPTAAENMAHKKLVKGIEDEKKMAQWIEQDLLPRVEKEDARVQRARKRIAEATRVLQAAELRSTRTRRSTKKIDYTYGDDDDDEPTSKRKADAWEPVGRSGRVFIPGERRSTRTVGRLGQDDDEESNTSEMPPLQQEEAPSRDPSPIPVAISTPVGKKRTKGYAWVEEYVLNGVVVAAPAEAGTASGPGPRGSGDSHDFGAHVTTNGRAGNQTPATDSQRVLTAGMGNRDSQDGASESDSADADDGDYLDDGDADAADSPQSASSAESIEID